MSREIPERWERPVVVTSLGRSGSTLLQRVLNVHPGLTVWGEHGGFLEGIADAYRISQKQPIIDNLDTGKRVRDTVIGELSNKEAFIPWVSPFDAHDLETALRTTVLDLFTRGLSPEIRWGFKEIRYDAPTLRTFMDMFPGAHVVLLARDLDGYVASRFFAFEHRDFDLVNGDGPVVARKRVARLVKGWLRRNEAMLALAMEMPDQCSLMAYSDLVENSPRIPALFNELGEAPPPAGAIEQVIGAVAGSSFTNDVRATNDRAALSEIVESIKFKRDRYARIAAGFGISV